jgi:hypothetical protein
MNKNSVNLPIITLNSRKNTNLSSEIRYDHRKSSFFKISRNVNIQSTKTINKDDYYSGVLNSTKESFYTVSTNKEKNRLSQNYSTFNTTSKENSSLYTSSSNFVVKEHHKIFYVPVPFFSYKPIRKKILFNQDNKLKSNSTSLMNKHYLQRKIIFQNLKNSTDTNNSKDVILNQSKKIVNVNFNFNLPNNSQDIKWINLRKLKSHNNTKFKQK